MSDITILSCHLIAADIPTFSASVQNSPDGNTIRAFVMEEISVKHFREETTANYLVFLFQQFCIVV